MFPPCDPGECMALVRHELDGEVRRVFGLYLATRHALQLTATNQRSAVNTIGMRAPDANTHLHNHPLTCASLQWLPPSLSRPLVSVPVSCDHRTVSVPVGLLQAIHAITS